jgi:hypothetical protein
MFTSAVGPSRAIAQAGDGGGGGGGSGGGWGGGDGLGGGLGFGGGPIPVTTNSAILGLLFPESTILLIISR